MPKASRVHFKNPRAIRWFAIVIGALWTGQSFAAPAASSAQTMTKSEVDELLGKQPDVPRRVVYKRPSAAAERQAVDLLIAHPILSGDRKYTVDEVFAKRVICGPGIWLKIKDEPNMKAIVRGVVELQVPNSIGTQAFPGKLFQSKAEIEAFWNDFLKKYPATKSTIRRPTFGELDLYWAMITFDITEPLFVVESKDASILVQFVGNAAKRRSGDLKMRIIWIDDYKNMKLVRFPPK